MQDRMDAYGYRRELGTQEAPSRDLLALGDQARLIESVCAERGLRLVSLFTERRDSVAEFRALLEEAGAASSEVAVVLPSLAVFGDRARTRLARVLQLRASGLEVVLADGDSLEDAMRAAWDARDDTERHRERVREGMRRLALRGRVLGRAPYGYRIDGHRLEIDAPEADVVREVVRLYLDEGLGVRRIAAVLNERGLTTRRGGAWSATAVRDILRNPAYLGTYRRLGVIVAGAHRAIVTRAQFDEVQRRMAGRRTAPSEQRREEYLLAGLVRCGYCGNRVIGVRRPGSATTLRYYQCESATNQGRCGYHTRRAEELEDAVRRSLATDTPTAEASSDRELPPATARLEVRRRGLHRDIDRALDLWAAGEWSLARLVAQAGARALADLEVELELEALARRPATALPVDDARERLIMRWDDLDPEERRTLLTTVVAEVVVTDDDVRVALSG